MSTVKSKGRPTKGADKPWRDESTLRSLYWDEWMDARGVADELGCSHRTVLNWMDKFGISRRKSGDQSKAHFGLNSDGYEYWETYVDGEKISIPVHRLVVVAEYGVKYWGDWETHHENELSWDNRHENLKPVPKDEHARLHWTGELEG